MGELKSLMPWLRSRQEARLCDRAERPNIRALFEKVLKGVAVAAEEQSIEFVREWLYAVSCDFTDLPEQLMKLLFANPIEAALRLTAFTMAVLNEPATALRGEEDVAGKYAHGVAAATQEQDGDEARPAQTVDDRRRIPTLDSLGAVRWKRRTNGVGDIRTPEDDQPAPSPTLAAEQFGKCRGERRRVCQTQKRPRSFSRRDSERDGAGRRLQPFDEAQQPFRAWLFFSNDSIERETRGDRIGGFQVGLAQMILLSRSRSIWSHV